MQNIDITGIAENIPLGYAFNNVSTDSLKAQWEKVLR